MQIIIYIGKFEYRKLAAFSIHSARATYHSFVKYGLKKTKEKYLNYIF